MCSPFADPEVRPSWVIPVGPECRTSVLQGRGREHTGQPPREDGVSLEQRRHSQHHQGQLAAQLEGTPREAWPCPRLAWRTPAPGCAGTDSWCVQPGTNHSSPHCTAQAATGIPSSAGQLHAHCFISPKDRTTHGHPAGCEPHRPHHVASETHSRTQRRGPGCLQDVPRDARLASRCQSAEEMPTCGVLGRVHPRTRRTR